MALVKAHFFSEALGLQRTMDVVLPQASSGIGVAGSASKGGKWPVLYLLHGWSDDHTIWQRRTSIERYALEKGLAVVMPGTDLGLYNDMEYGYDFWRFFSEELPALVREFFPCISDKREDTFVAGLSMGGYGALKLGINCPERFSYAASLSGLVDPAAEYQKKGSKEHDDAWYNSFGPEETFKGSVSDIQARLDALIASGKTMPKFYVTCGTEDFLHEQNVKFRDKYQGKIDMVYHEEPGIHEWGYWDRNIQKVINWLPLEAAKGVK